MHSQCSHEEEQSGCKATIMGEERIEKIKPKPNKTNTLAEAQFLNKAERENSDYFSNYGGPARKAELVPQIASGITSGSSN